MNFNNSMDSFLVRLLSRQTPEDDAPPPPDPVPAHHANAVVAFIIGLAIVVLASVLNAAGLNLTKLDHVRTVGSLSSSWGNHEDLINIYSGAHERNTEKCTTERLVMAAMALGHAPLHVRPIPFHRLPYLTPLDEDFPS